VTSAYNLRPRCPKSLRFTRADGIANPYCSNSAQRSAVKHPQAVSREI
jgi:hypothetical protein